MAIIDKKETKATSNITLCIQCFTLSQQVRFCIINMENKKAFYIMALVLEATSNR